MAESQVVTVLFTDLVGSTAHEERVGSDRWDGLRAEHFSDLRAVLRSHRGTEVKTAGDGMMAVFLSALDALDAAVSMQQTVDRGNRRRGDEPIGLRVGLSAGEVTTSGDDWFGLPVTEAARLCANAVGGQVLASEIVRSLCRGRGSLRFESVSAMTLKGLAEPVEVCEVAWEPLGGPLVPMPARLAAPADASRFVGRHSERDVLATAWKEVAAGSRRLIVVAGEPGIGKTRLASELAVEVHESGGTVLFGRCQEGLPAPYLPFAEALREYVRVCPGDRLASHLHDAGGELGRIVPEVHDRLADLPSPLRADPDSERYAMFEAIDAVLARASSDAPVLMILDDLHWADPPTLMLLRHLARSATPAALLIVGTYRETELTRVHPLAEMLADLRREHLMARVLLRGLSRGEIAEMVGGTGSTESLADLAAALEQETDGNPFFVEEVLQHLAETGGLIEEDDAIVLGRPIEELGIPEGVREVVGRRLARLPEGADELLSVAAVVGREFGVDVLERCGRVVGDTLVDILDAAASARLVSEVPDRVGYYTFSHALVRQVLYDELSAVRRARLHWRVGEVIRDRFGDAAIDDLAHHFLEGALAGEVTVAVDVAIRAGDRATTVLAFEQALSLYRRALSTLEQAQPTPDQTIERLRFRAQLGAARSLIAIGDNDASWEASLRAADLAQSLDDPAGVAEAIFLFAFVPRPPDQDLITRVEAAFAGLTPQHGPERVLLSVIRLVHEATWSTLAATDGLLERTAQLIDDARPVGDRRALGYALMCGAHARRGSHAERDALALVKEVEQLGDVVEMFPGFRSVYFGIASVAAGDRAGFDAARSEVGHLAGLTTSLFPRFVSALWDSIGAQLDGRWADAKAAAVRARGTSEAAQLFYAGQISLIRLEQGRGPQLVDGLAQLTASTRAEPNEPARLEDVARPLIEWRAVLLTCLLDANRNAEAAEEIEDLLRNRRLADLPGGWAAPIWLAHLAEAAIGLEHVGLASALAPVIERYSGLLLVPYYGTGVLGAADRAIAHVAATLGHHDEAEARYRSALDLERGFGARPQAARTLYWSARLLAARGDPRARSIADEARSEAAALAMPLLEQQAAAI